MSTERFGQLTVRGLQVLHRLGNGNPSLSQIDFVQSIINLILEHEDTIEKLDQLLESDIQSKESLRRDNLHNRKFAISNSPL